MTLFLKTNKLQFQPIDPLGDGLRDLIATEMDRPESIGFMDDIDGASLVSFWEKISSDIHNL